MKNKDLDKMTNYSFTKEDGIAISTEKVFIPNLNLSTNIWIYTENEQLTYFSVKQKHAFDEFLKNTNALNEIKTAAKTYYNELLAQNDRIVPSEENSFDFDYEAIAIPSQQNTEKHMIFLLVNTNWQLVDSEYFMELEIYFENGTLTELTELSGSYIFQY